jgi:hypothetical protein
MNNGQNFFVYRPLSEESSEVVRNIQDQYVSLESFQPVDDMHLTLLGRHVLPKTPKQRLLPIVRRGPATSEESYSMEVSGIQFADRTHIIGRSAIQLLLKEDDADAFHSEHSFFRLTAEKFGSTIANRNDYPHVTIGYLETSRSLLSILQQGRALVGESLSFDPIQSDLGAVKAEKVDESKKNVPRLKKPKTGHRAENDYTTDMPSTIVRTVRAGGIPSGLLSSLRTLSSDNTI